MPTAYRFSTYDGLPSAWSFDEAYQVGLRGRELPEGAQVYTWAYMMTMPVFGESFDQWVSAFALEDYDRILVIDADRLQSERPYPVVRSEDVNRVGRVWMDDFKEAVWDLTKKDGFEDYGEGELIDLDGDVARDLSRDLKSDGEVGWMDAEDWAASREDQIARRLERLASGVSIRWEDTIRQKWEEGRREYEERQEARQEWNEERGRNEWT